MGSIHIEGNEPRELPRGPYDLRRNPATPRRAVCHAATSSLHLRADGSVGPCPHSGMTLGKLNGSTLTSVWSDPRRAQLTREFADYRVQRKGCQHCVAWWEDDLAPCSPAQLVYDELPAADADAETPKWLRLDVDAPWQSSLPELRGWLSRLRHLELGIQPRTDPQQWRGLLAEVRRLPAEQRPRVTLHAQHTVPVGAEQFRELAEVHVHLELKQPAPALLTELTSLAAKLTQAGIPLFLHALLDRDNWLHLWSWLQQTKAAGIRLAPALADTTSQRSLAGLQAPLLAAVHGVLARWKNQAEAGGVSAQEWQPLLARLRRWQQQTTADQTDLGLPPLDHPVLAHDEEALAFLGDFLRSYRATGVSRWLRQLTRTAGFAVAARQRRPLRLAALWLACVFEHRPTERVLRSLYRSRSGARELTRADAKALAGSTWEGWFRGWSEALRLTQLVPRRPPFVVPNLPAKVPGGRRAVTVMIPSYNHQKYIRQTMESVLSQTAGNLRLLVVDDASSDQTVETAQKVRDSRVTVSRNPRNLGLGRSLHAALRKVTTPYVAILNSDDLFHSERLQQCLALMKARARTQVVATGLVPIDARDRQCSAADSSPLFDGRQVFEWLQWYDNTPPPPASTKDFLGPLLERNFLLTSSNIFARTTFLREHAAAWKDLEFCLDWQIFLQAALDQSLAVLPASTLGYRLHETNTVWFDKERKWRYYVEANQVVARILSQLLDQRRRSKGDRAGALLDALSPHLLANTSVDGTGIVLGLFLEKLKMTSRDLAESALSGPVAALEEAHSLRLEAENKFAEHRENLADLLRLWGERSVLESARNSHEALADELHHLEGELLGALQDRSNIENLWHQAEHDRDQEVAGKAELYQQIGDLQGQTEAAQFETRERQKELREREEELATVRQDLDGKTEQLRSTTDALQESRSQQERTEAELTGEREARQDLAERHTEVERERDEIRSHLDQRTSERDQLQQSPEYRVGTILLNKLGLRTPLDFAERSFLRARHQAGLLRLSADARGWNFRRRQPYRAMATICWNFPIYSQTFVYQELTQLWRRGFDLRLVYSKLEPRSHLHRQFEHLWSMKTAQVLHKKTALADYHHYQQRMPERVEALIRMIIEASGQDRDFIEHHDNFRQAFSYTRMVEAYRPDYLHSYFFYDRSLFSLIAGYLLDIPRGVSCYADHVMDDYEFKMVPLHLQLCEVVIATSRRIKRELLEIAPATDPARILVKPNAVDSNDFPVLERQEPAEGQPFRVVCVARIEPKKGLLHLVEAAALLRERGFPVEFHIVGEADQGIQASIDYAARLNARIEALDLWGMVHLEGRQEQAGVRRFLEMSQLFIAPFVETESGDKDGIPTALLEGMASGLPALTTDAGSMIEVVDPGEDGEIVPQGDPEALADALVRLLEDCEGRRTLARNAAKKIRCQFDVNVCERIFHDRVLDLIAARRRKA